VDVAVSHEVGLFGTPSTPYVGGMAKNEKMSVQLGFSRGAGGEFVPRSGGTRTRLTGLEATSLTAIEERQFRLYKPMVIDRVKSRFASLADAEAWFASGEVPGFGPEMTPAKLVKRGLGAQVIEAINAIEAGVHA
jgi:hypothetical protein